MTDLARACRMVDEGDSVVHRVRDELSKALEAADQVEIAARRLLAEALFDRGRPGELVGKREEKA